ncbi:MAG: AsmA family protein [Candidatus Hydrogenedentota bacterium]
MTDSKTDTKQSWVRRHKWLTALAVFAVLLFAIVQVVEYFVDIERYRGHIVQLIEDRTEMPASIDRLELALFPQPAISAHNVAVGEDGLSAQCSEVRATANWSGLLSREITISRITLNGVSVSLPKEFAKISRRIEIIREKSKKESPSKWQVHIESIRARSAQILMAGVKNPVFEGSVTVRDVLADTIPIEAEGALPFLGASARGDADVVIALHKGASPALVPSGWIEVHGVDPREAFDREAMPPLILEAKAAFDEVTADTIGLKVDGEASAAKGAPELVRAAAGPFDGMLWIGGGEVTLNAFELKAPNFTMRADATRTTDGAVACEIQNAKVHGDALAAVYAIVNSEKLELVPNPEAAITASGLLFGVDTEGALRLVEGDLDFKNVTPTLADGATPFGDIQGKVHIDEGIVHIDDITGTGLSIQGTVKPDFERRRAAIDLAGGLSLSPAVTKVFVKTDALMKLSGNINFKRIAGTFEKGKPLPEDLKIDGTIEQGELALALAGIEETLTSLSGRFQAEPDAVSLTASGQSTLVGPVSTDARIIPQKQHVTGTLKTDLANLNLPFPEDKALRNVVKDIARTYGTSNFAVDITLPTAETPEGSIQVARQESPALSAVIALARKDDAVSVVSANTAGTVPMPPFRALFPEGIQMDGTAAVTADVPMTADQFVAHVDLAQTLLRYGDYITKETGDPATADVLFARVNDQWEPQTVTVHYGAEELVARFEEDRITSEFELDVTALKNLFDQKVRADGSVAGTFRTSPTEFDVILQNGALGLSEELHLDAINGRVRYADETPQFDNLAVQGLNSDFTITMQQSPAGIWQGTLQGKRLDIDALTAAVEGFKGKDDTPATAESQAAKDTSESSFPDMDLDVRLAKVLYRNAQVDDVRATVNGRNGMYDIQDLFMGPGNGTVTGTAQVELIPEPSPSTITMNLSLKDVDLAVIDGIAFSTPRGLKGLTTGTVDITAPFGGGVNPTNGTTGNIEFVSRDGTLGTMGIATKILTVMRTTEIIRLRMPPTKDEGIAFDTCAGTATLESGFMTLDEFSLLSPTPLSYCITMPRLKPHILSLMI